MSRTPTLVLRKLAHTNFHFYRTFSYIFFSYKQDERDVPTASLPSSLPRLFHASIVYSRICPSLCHHPSQITPKIIRPTPPDFDCYISTLSLNHLSLDHRLPNQNHPFLIHHQCPFPFLSAHPTWICPHVIKALFSDSSKNPTFLRQFL